MSYFTEVETETQRGLVTCQDPKGREWQSRDLNLNLRECESPRFFPLHGKVVINRFSVLKNISASGGSTEKYSQEDLGSLCGSD